MPCSHCGEDHLDTVLYCPKTGELIAEHLLPENSVLEGKYLIGRPLGIGGMGAVFEAEHSLLKKKVAIKVMLSTDQQAIARLTREARAASATGHVNIAMVTDMGKTENGSLFVVMEYLDGRTLSDVVEDSALPTKRALRLISQVLAGLDVVHSKGILHRDLKPDNLMIVHNNEGQEVIKILDFGISKALDDDSGKLGLTDTGLVMGTPLYMSPEQARAETNLGPECDIYAVGAILYKMVTQKPPHQASNIAELLAKKLNMSVKAPSTLVETLPEEFDRIVLKALDLNAENRYPSAHAMRKDILALLESLKENRASFIPSAPKTGHSHPKIPAPTLEASDLTAGQSYEEDIASYDALDKLDSLEDASLVHLDVASGIVSPEEAKKLRDEAQDKLEIVAKKQKEKDSSDVYSSSPLPYEEEESLELEELEKLPESKVQNPIIIESANARRDVSKSFGTAKRSQSHGIRNFAIFMVLIGLAAGGYFFLKDSHLLEKSEDIHINFDVLPKSAMISVDGIPLVTQPLILKRSKKNYQIKIEAKGYQTELYDLIPDKSVLIEIELKSLATIKKDSLPADEELTTKPDKKNKTKKNKRKSKQRAN